MKVIGTNLFVRKRGEEMRKFRILLLGLFAMLLSDASYSQMACGIGGGDAGAGFTVVSEAEVECYPDTLWVVFGISTEGLSVEEAMSENKRVFEGVEKVLNGKEFKDYKLKMFPVKIGKAGTSYEIRQKKVLGFKVDRWIRLERKGVNQENVDKMVSGVSKIMDILSKAGVTEWGIERSYGSAGKAIWYGVMDKEKYEIAAKKKAYAKLAEAKNREVKNSGVKIKQLKSLKSASYSKTSYYSGMNQSGILPVCPLSDVYRELKIKGSVYATYEIEEAE